MNAAAVYLVLLCVCVCVCDGIVDPLHSSMTWVYRNAMEYSG